MVNDAGTLNFDITQSEVGYICLRFVEVVVCSILIGMAVGLVTTIIFKNWRFLVHEKGLS
jgi:flagellar biosynthesis protein FliR